MAPSKVNKTTLPGFVLVYRSSIQLQGIGSQSLFLLTLQNLYHGNRNSVSPLLSTPM